MLFCFRACSVHCLGPGLAATAEMSDDSNRPPVIHPNGYFSSIEDNRCVLMLPVLVWTVYGCCGGDSGGISIFGDCTTCGLEPRNRPAIGSSMSYHLVWTCGLP